MAKVKYKLPESEEANKILDYIKDKSEANTHIVRIKKQKLNKK